MKTSFTSRSHPVLRNHQAIRGSVLITALIFAIIIGITLVGYVKLSTNSLKLAHRTFFADAASNLAEAGTEEAVWSFNTLGNRTGSTATAEAWQSTGNVWTIGGVSSIYVTSSGSGYTSAPTVTISPPGGSGTTATANAIITTSYTTTGGVTTATTKVTGFTITNYGSGYTSVPTVAIGSGGGGTGAAATVRLAATRTFTFPNLDQNASGTVKVWVDGYDGSNVLPVVVSKATITPREGAPIEKIIKITLGKNGVLPKGLIAKNGIDWNGHPIADSYVSSTIVGVPPFSNYLPSGARSNTTVGALLGPEIDLGSQGVISGNVAIGPGVRVTGSGTVTGSTVPLTSYDFALPTYPTFATHGGVVLDPAEPRPTVLPRPADITGGVISIPADPVTGAPAVYSTMGTVNRAADPVQADGKYYYYVSGATIGNVTIEAGKNVVIVGTSNGATKTTMVSGFRVPASGALIGSAEIYINGKITLTGNDNVNKITSPNTSWAGALSVYTSTTDQCTMSGNAAFYGSFMAPYAELTGNGGGNDTTDLCGSFVVGSITSNGHMSFHYDEGLGNPTNPKPWTLGLWTELQTLSERALYAQQLNF